MFDRIRDDFRVHGRKLRSRTFCAMLVYRFGQWTEALRLAPTRWLLQKIYGFVQSCMPMLTGITIDAHMKVGQRFHLIHAGEIQIHPDVVFGDDCGIMHNVTIGQNMNSGVPKFGNRVFIGAGAVILGEITIGDDVRIAANSLVITNVPPGALAMGVPARVYPHLGPVREHGDSVAPAAQLQHPRANGIAAQSVAPEPAGNPAPR